MTAKAAISDQEQHGAAIERADEDVRRHASTALPLSANMPRGRFWMNRMMSTRMAILPSTAPAKRLKELVGDAEHERADQRAPQIADAAEHHDHEAVDDVALAEIGADIVDLRQRDAGDAGDAGAEPESKRVDARGADAHRRPPWRGSASPRASQGQAGEAQHAEQRDEHRQREADDPQPVIGDGDAAEVEGAAHPGRIADLAVGRPEVVRTACCRISERPQVASRVSSGRP